MKQEYWVYGINDMGSTWFVSGAPADRATLWSGAPKECRHKFSKNEALEMVNHLDKVFEFCSTRHYIMEVTT